MPDEWRMRVRQRKFTLLLLALLIMILGPALRGDPDSGASGLLWGVVLVAAVYAGAGTGRVTLIFVGFAVIVFGGRLGTLFAPAFTYENQFDAGAYIVTVIFLGMTIYAVFSAVLRAPHVDGDTIMGAVCVYLLIGFMWSNFYALIYMADPGSFSFPAHTLMGDGSIIPEFTFGYYSFVTLTTLGYGDVLPISFRARTLSWMEAVVGVTYMATVIALLVSRMIVGQQQGREL